MFYVSMQKTVRPQIRPVKKIPTFSFNIMKSPPCQFFSKVFGSKIISLIYDDIFSNLEKGGQKGARRKAILV